MGPDGFSGQRVLITGGLGFIGSNLARRLLDLGAEVICIDSMLPGMGGNPFNIEGIDDRITVNFCDVRDRNSIGHIVRGVDTIFHLAGQNDHVLSQTDPFPDIDINIVGSTVLLEACRQYNPEVRLIYSGTRGEYGPAIQLPVAEDAPVNPKGVYELSSMMVQKLFQIYHDNHNLKTITLRLSNIYGPRAQMKHNRFGVANWFVRLGLDGQGIQVFGDGSLIRDFLYVDDTVDAMIAIAQVDEAYGQTFNLGHSARSTFKELAETVVRHCPESRWDFAPFSPERAKQEPGHFCSDITKITSTCGWSPSTNLDEGVRRTVAFYRQHRDRYW